MNQDSSEQKTPKSTARRMVTILLVCVLLLGAGAIAFVWLALTPKHLVSGMIRIAPTVQDIWGSGHEPLEANYPVFMQTQAVLLSSDTRTLLKVVDDLDGRGLAFLSSAKTPAAKEGEIPGPDGILRQVIADGVIKIAPLPNSELLEVAMISENAEEAKTIVNSFLRNYIGGYGVDETTMQSQKITMLENRRNELQSRILQGRAKLRALVQQYGETESHAMGSTNLDLQDMQSRIKLDEEFHEKTCRRLYEIGMERDRPPRVQIASLAEIKEPVDHRGRWTLLILGATVVLSIVLLIVRRVVRWR